jgi:hypothetical protein
MRRTCSTHGEDKHTAYILAGNQKGRHHLEDLGVDGSLILKLISKKQDV